MISVSIFDCQSTVRTQTRTGGFCGSPDAFHTALCAANKRMSASQTWAVSRTISALRANVRHGRTPVDREVLRVKLGGDGGGDILGCARTLLRVAPAEGL